jgi:hypothetical protein
MSHIQVTIRVNKVPSETNCQLTSLLPHDGSRPSEASLGGGLEGGLIAASPTHCR